MLIKDLIKQLQEIYARETRPEYLELFGEPEIMIDTFNEDPRGNGSTFVYTGFDRDVRIDRSRDGVYLILSRFKVGDN